MVDFNKRIFIDDNDKIAYPEQGTQTILLPNGHMKFTMCLPQTPCLLVEQNSLKSINTAKLDNTIKLDYIIENIKSFCDLGRNRHIKEDKQDLHKTPFERHYALGIRAANFATNFAHHPMIDYSMNLHFGYGNDLSRIVYGFGAEEIHKVDRHCYSNDKINYMAKPAGFKKLGYEERDISMAFAFAYCCDETPQLKQSYETYRKNNSQSKKSFAEKLTYYQGYVVGKALAMHANDKNNKIPLLVSLYNKKTNQRELQVATALSKDEARKSFAHITNPMKNPFALINGIIIAEEIGKIQSSLGQCDYESTHKEDVFCADNILDVGMRTQAFIQNYNKEYATKTLPLNRRNKASVA